MWWRRRALLKAFVRRDLQERFAGSVLGPLGLFLQPLAQIVVFVFLFKYIFKVRIRVGGGFDEDFLRFFLAGFIPWSIHNEAFLRGANSLLAQGYLLTKAVFPAEILPASSVIASYILGIPALVFLAVILYFSGGLSHLSILAPGLLLLQFFFTLGVAFFFAALLVYLRDLQQFMGLISMVWFYATPILYSVEMLPEGLRPLFWANPFTYFVRLWQALFLGLPYTHTDLVVAGLASALSYALGHLFFERCRAGFADVL